MKHTPTPWKMDANSVQTAINTENNEKHIAMVNYNQRYMTENEHYANAEFILKAVNNHDDMLEALEKIANLDPGKDSTECFNKAQAIAKALIAKVKQSS